jgi:hypothetical protein
MTYRRIAHSILIGDVLKCAQSRHGGDLIQAKKRVLVRFGDVVGGKQPVCHSTEVIRHASSFTSDRGDDR